VQQLLLVVVVVVQGLLTGLLLELAALMALNQQR
jgi:hypothetical protein